MLWPDLTFPASGLTSTSAALAASWPTAALALRTLTVCGPGRPPARARGRGARRDRVDERRPLRARPARAPRPRRPDLRRRARQGADAAGLQDRQARRPRAGGAPRRGLVPEIWLRDPGARADGERAVSGCTWCASAPRSRTACTRPWSPGASPVPSATCSATRAGSCSPGSRSRSRGTRRCARAYG
jgi:hypothetical protein